MLWVCAGLTQRAQSISVNQERLCLVCGVCGAGGGECVGVCGAGGGSVWVYVVRGGGVWVCVVCVGLMHVRNLSALSG